jgi:TetR/AcrR family transcriptional regulator, transcriptional repressor for nem operon
VGRPRAFDSDETLLRAMRLFWERGYEATSIQDLVDALGVNRASLYGAFGDKAEIFEAALDRYSAHVQAGVRSALAPPHRGREAVGRYFRAIIEQATEPGLPRGCLVLNTALGCSTAPPAVLHRVREAIRRNEDVLHRALARDPALRARSDLRALAQFFAAHGHGLAVKARIGTRPAELFQSAELALRVLDTPPPGQLDGPASPSRASTSRTKARKRPSEMASRARRIRSR